MLDYPLTPYLWDGVRRAFRTMAELQFAAGATQVMPIHGAGDGVHESPAPRSAGIDAFALAPLVDAGRVGARDGRMPDGQRRATRPPSIRSGRFHHLANLHVVDGSLFPTSIGANPQLSIYAIAAKLADGLAATLQGRPPGDAPD